MAENSHNNQRGSGRPFPKGKSGNPSGKPRGTRSKVTIMAEKMLADDAEGVVQAVINAAKEGDMIAARLVLDRILPVRKGRPIALELPDVEDARGVAAAQAALVEAMADGVISPEEAAAAASVIELQRRAVETADLEQRVIALEASHGK